MIGIQVNSVLGFVEHKETTLFLLVRNNIIKLEVRNIVLMFAERGKTEHSLSFLAMLKSTC